MPRIQDAPPQMKHPAFVPSLSPASRYSAFGALESGVTKGEQFWVVRLDRDLNGSFHFMADNLEAAVEFGTKASQDGDRFQVLSVFVEEGSARMVEFADIAPYHFNVGGSVGFQFRDDGDWFTDVHSERCGERERTATCPWSDEPVATVRDIARATANRRRPPNYGNSGAGTGRLEAGTGHHGEYAR